MFREHGIVTKNVSECCISVLSLEGSSAIEHLVDEDSQGPPVNGAGMPTSFDDFWSNVLLGADKGIRAEVCNAGFCVNGRERGRRGTVTADNHRRGTARIGLFGEIKV